MSRLVDHERLLPYTAPQFNDRSRYIYIYGSVYGPYLTPDLDDRPPEPFGVGLELDIREMLGRDEVYPNPNPNPNPNSNPNSNPNPNSNSNSNSKWCLM